VAGLAEGIELSLGAPQGSTGWLVSARDLDKTFIGTPQDFVGVMDATITLHSPLGERFGPSKMAVASDRFKPTLRPSSKAQERLFDVSSATEL
jgi:hypothetical protein